jgi:excisionase family DNA binding protein
MTNSTELWLCITDYADTYGVHRSTVYKWLDANLLEVYRVERVVRIKNKPPNLHIPQPSTSTSVGLC